MRSLIAALLVAVAQEPPKSQGAAPLPNPEEKPKPAQAPAPPPIAPAAGKRPLQELPYTPSLDLAAMDRGADPCGSFYQYVCGGWIKSNPIPPDQASWSVYGKLGDENEQYLWGILEDAARPEAQRTPVQQKIGDYFASCMDEPAAEQLGAAPLQAELAKIEAIKSLADVSALLPLLHLATSGNGLMFGFGSDQDFGDASQVIAFISAGGLGLPDRDYYFKDDAKSKEIRDRYLQHVQGMLELIGQRDAAAGAREVMRMETA